MAGPASTRRASALHDYLRGELSREPRADVIPRRPAGEPIRLSFGQEQLWFLTHLAPDMPVCNEPMTIRRAGGLDEDVLNQTLGEVLERHEVLRMRCSTRDGEPFAEIAPPGPWQVRTVDLSHVPGDLREARAHEVATEEARRPFALDGEPLLRTTLARLTPSDSRLFVTLHQLVIDCTAIYQALLPDLAATYESLAAGRPARHEAPSLQYPDFARWQREHLRDASESAQLDYWRERLGGAPATLDLRTDRQPPPRRTFRGGMHAFRFPRALSADIRALSHGERVTPFMTLLASFLALLFLDTRREDLLVGTATAGRRRPELAPLMGYFLNYLVLRTDLSGDPSFRELLKRVRDVTLGALDHDEIPFDRLVRELAPSRASSRNPLFQVALVHSPGLSNAYGSGSATGIAETGWNLSQLDVDLGISKFDLSVDIDDGPEFVVGRLFYSTDLFELATVARLIERWKALLETVVVAPERRLSTLAGERDAVALTAPRAQPGEPAGEPERLFVAPRDDLERRVAALWQRELGVERVGIRDDFFDLGGHSLMAVRMFYEIERSFGRRLPLATLFEAPTVETLAAVLRQDDWAPRWSALVEIQPHGNRPPFFCIHGHGGHVLLFNNLAKALGDEQPLYGLQAVGLDGSTAPHRTFEEMAAHYIAEMRSVQRHGPYLIGGYCLGGPVAYEVARQLEARGEEVGLLALFDGFRPGYPRLRRGVPEAAYRVAHRTRILAFHSSMALRLGRSTGRRYMVESLKRGLAGKIAKPGRPNPLARTQSALMSAYRAYRPQPYTGKVVLFRATGMPLFTAEAADMGWAGLARGGIEIEEIPVYYTTAFSGPNVEVVAKKLERRISDHIEQLRAHREPARAAS